MSHLYVFVYGTNYKYCCISLITSKYSFVPRVYERKRIYYRGEIEIRAYLVETTSKSQLFHETDLTVGGNGFKIPTSIRRKPKRPANDRLFAGARCGSNFCPILTNFKLHAVVAVNTKIPRRKFETGINYCSDSSSDQINCAKINGKYLIKVKDR